MVTVALREGMKEEGVSLRILADLSHHSTTSLHRKLGNGNITADDAARLAQHLGLDTRMKAASHFSELAPRVLDGPAVDQHHMVAMVRTDEELVEAAEAIGRLRRLAGEMNPSEDDLDRMHADALQVRQVIDAAAHLLRTLNRRFDLDLMALDAEHATRLKASGYTK